MTRIQELKAALHSRGLNPRKSFGQNFMIDPNFAAAIARAANPDERTLILEVGPGTGLLTRALLDAHPKSRVLAVEIDRGLAALLRETLHDPRLTLIEGDVLERKHVLSKIMISSIFEISKNENRPRRVLCSNLPYNAGTSILANLAIDADSLGFESAIATVQLELAQRLLAKPGEDEYGALSVLMALRADGKIIRKAGAEIFWPRPSVESAVIDLRFKNSESSPLKQADAAGFQQFLQKLFSQRRKTLRATLKPLIIPKSSTISPDARAEQLSPEEMLALFSSLKP